ncbi:MAG TPA: hypothetical protein VGB85_02115 [Nannocystis sp.]|jgi:hypothetical protein
MGYDGSLNHITHMHRDSGGGSKRSSIRTYQLGPGSSREEFPCMFLCDGCGYLCWTDPPCPACGKKAWIDLGFWNHAEALRSREEEERRHPPERLKWQVRMAAVTAGSAIGLGSAAGLALGGVVLAAPLVLTLGAGASLLTYAFGRRQIGWSIMTRRVDHPTRWHVPLPLADPGAKPVSQLLGAAHPTGALLRAPFSGRPCIGYDVGVVFDTPGDAWPPIWVLREMHSCAFEIQGKTIDAGGVSLALPIKPVAEPAITGEQKKKFLRERGLFLADGKFDLFEAIIEPGSTYEMLWPSAPGGAAPILRAAPQARAGDPYR